MDGTPASTTPKRARKTRSVIKLGLQAVMSARIDVLNIAKVIRRFLPMASERVAARSMTTAKMAVETDKVKLATDGEI
jgi:hypothetical protein